MPPAITIGASETHLTSTPHTSLSRLTKSRAFIPSILPVRKIDAEDAMTNDVIQCMFTLKSAPLNSVIAAFGMFCFLRATSIYLKKKHTEILHCKGKRNEHLKYVSIVLFIWTNGNDTVLPSSIISNIIHQFWGDNFQF